MKTPKIDTTRLILNSFVATDARALFAYRSDPEICRYQSWEPFTLDEAQHFVSNLTLHTFATPGTWYQLAVRLRDSSELVGDLGVHFLADQPKQVEIGFTLAPIHQGQGYGTEAVIGLLNYLFGPLKKHRVFASTDPRNKASISLLKRLGMRQEAHFHKSLWFKGAWADDLIFAILASEWKKR